MNVVISKQVIMNQPASGPADHMKLYSLTKKIYDRYKFEKNIHKNIFFLPDYRIIVPASAKIIF